MRTVFTCWAALGAAAGVIHAAALWRAAHCRHDSMLVAAWRLPIVVSVLIAAALLGGLLPAVGGWGCGLAGASVLLVARSPRC